MKFQLALAGHEDSMQERVRKHINSELLGRVKSGLDAFLIGFKIDAEVITSDAVYDHNFNDEMLFLDKGSDDCLIVINPPSIPEELRHPGEYLVANDYYPYLSEYENLAYDELCQLFGYDSDPFMRDCFKKALRQPLNNALMINGRYTDDWIKGKELRVFSLKGVKNSVTEAVISGLEKFIHDYSLDFKVIDHGDSWPFYSYISYDEDGYVNDAMTARNFTFYHNENDQPHGVVLILDKPFSRSVWGVGEYKYGIILIAPKNQDATSLIKRVSYHEFHCLLGTDDHCEYDQRRRDKYGEHLTYDPNCNFNYSAPSLNDCLKCRTVMDRLIYRIEKKHGINLRKC